MCKCGAMRSDETEIVEAIIDIAESTTLSNVMNIEGRVVIAIATPDALTSTGITFKAGLSEDALLDVCEYSGESPASKSVAVAPDKWIPLPLDYLGAFHFFQIEMGTEEVADRAIKLITKRV